MSSSADPPGWDAFADREVPGEFELLSPASELAAALQRIHADLGVAREDTEAARIGVHLRADRDLHAEISDAPP